jgi:hypothetical protein
MLLTIFWGAIAGGAIAWIWGAISWMVLPWHHATFLSFTDEADIARVVLDGCPRSGVYGLPAPPRYPPGADKAAREAIDYAANRQMQVGPIVTAVVQRGGFGSVPTAMMRAFVIYAVAGGVMTWLLLQTSGLSYWERAGFVTGVALAASLICRMTDWNWHGYSTPYTVVCIADHVVSGFLVGLGLAGLV